MLRLRKGLSHTSSSHHLNKHGFHRRYIRNSGNILESIACATKESPIRVCKSNKYGEWEYVINLDENTLTVTGLDDIEMILKFDIRKYEAWLSKLG